MSMEFGWWVRHPEEGKFQVRVIFHGGNLEWKRKQGHHTSWELYGPPDEADWDKLMAEAETRLPRRLMSARQFEDLKRLRIKAGF